VLDLCRLGRVFDIVADTDTAIAELHAPSAPRRAQRPVPPLRSATRCLQHGNVWRVFGRQLI